MTANMYRVGGKKEIYNIITQVLNSRAGYSISCCVRIDIFVAWLRRGSCLDVLIILVV